MTTEVKPGQVWASKNTGSQWKMEHLIDHAGPRWWFMRHVQDNKSLSIPERDLVDDYVLVREAE